MSLSLRDWLSLHYVFIIDEGLLVTALCLYHWGTACHCTMSICLRDHLSPVTALCLYHWSLVVTILFCLYTWGPFVIVLFRSIIPDVDAHMSLYYFCLYSWESVVIVLFRFVYPMLSCQAFFLWSHWFKSPWLGHLYAQNSHINQA